MTSSPAEDIGADTRVFWDVEDFPVPEDRDLCLFRENVRRAISREGYVGGVSIHAYGGSKNEEQRCDFARAEIELVEESDKKHVRLHRLLVDLLGWGFEHANGNDGDALNYIVVAKDIPKENTRFVSILQRLKQKGHNVFVAVPDDIPLEQLLEQELPRTASVVWRWKALFDGENPVEELDSDWETDADCEEGSSQGAEKRQKITHAASHNFGCVDSPVKRLLKGGNEVDDILAAVIIRNLKAV